MDARWARHAAARRSRQNQTPRSACDDLPPQKRPECLGRASERLLCVPLTLAGHPTNKINSTLPPKPRVRLAVYETAPSSECKPMPAATCKPYTFLQPRGRLGFTTPHGKGTGGGRCVAVLGVSAQIRMQLGGLAQAPRD
eukprot:scaffold22245_cov135-Isochrysis_galbana.AAC.1